MLGVAGVLFNSLLWFDPRCVENLRNIIGNLQIKY